MPATTLGWSRVALCAAALTALPSIAQAELRAHFRVTFLNGGCLVDDEEGPLEGTPERHFRLAVFDSNSPAVLGACATGCEADDLSGTLDGQTQDECTLFPGCGSWDFADREISKVIPGGGGAYFYFGLFDDDSTLVTNPSDSLGDHWLFASGPAAGTPLNNNVSPYSPGSSLTAVCGTSVEGAGSSSNYRFSYSIWFSDSTPPTLATPTPNHTDDSLTNSGWDNDSRLDFNWSPASDPDSGISAYHVQLSDVTAGTVLFSDVEVPGSPVSVCTGCTLSHDPVHDHLYAFSYRATNGNLPTLNAPSWTTSGNRLVGVDRVSPSTAITAPPAGTWHGATFGVSLSDTDSGAGLSTCEYRVLSNGAQTVGWTSRSCGGSIFPSVGELSDCRHEGAGTCAIQARSVDVARNPSATAIRVYSIDLTGDPVSGLEAFTEPGGTAIAPGDWQPDATPHMTWDAASSSSPIVGYSYLWDGTPDCVVDTATEEASSPGPLSDGQRTFSVRAIDSAGNCGGVASFDLRVDATADSISGLQAFSESGGAPIAAATWQTDDTPWLSWSEPASASPIVGYSIAWNESADCAADTTTAEHDQSTPLGAGQHTFSVRAEDAAGNCGPESSFEVWVQVVLFADGFESGSTCSWSAAAPEHAPPGVDCSSAGFGPVASYLREGRAGSATIPEPLRVRLGQPAAVPTFVAISSSDPSVVSVLGGGVDVPAGGREATVLFDVGGPHPGVTLAATVGERAMQATVRVVGRSEIPALVALTPAATAVAAGGSTSITVELDIPAPVGGLSVDLRSSAGGTYPASIVVPADELTASFTYTAPEGAAVERLTAILLPESRSAMIEIIPSRGDQDPER